MSNTNLEQTIIKIVTEATKLRDDYTDQNDAPVSWCCIFCQNDDEYHDFKTSAVKIGQLVNDTPSGPVFVIPPVATVAGPVRVLKVRKPFPDWTERGDADFTTRNYATLKAKYANKPGFTVIDKGDFEMIEIYQPGYDARVYFSNPPVEQHEGIRQALAVA